MNNPWISFIDRSYSSIRSSLNAALKIKVPELTDYNPSNMLMIITDIFAGVAEMINYYIDVTARELYVPTARRFSSLIKLGELVGYYGRGRIASYVVVQLTSDTPLDPAQELLIPSGTEFTDDLGQSWRTTKNYSFRKGFSSINLYLRQFTPVSDISVGISDGEPNQIFPLPKDVAHGSLSVEVDRVQWNHVESLGFSGPSSKDYTLALKPDGVLYLIFGDGVKGQVPAMQDGIEISYWSTRGAPGNIPVNSITEVPNLSPPPSLTNLQINNLYPGYGGKDTETLEDFRRAIPLISRTLYRAVTEQDYIDIALLVPGVRSAALKFSCTLGAHIYLVAEGGGNLTQDFLDMARNFILSKSILGIPVFTYPSGETIIRGKVTVKGRYRVPGNVVHEEVSKKLLDLYNPHSSLIGQNVRTSDIIAAIDNLPSVDWLTLDNIYARPYLRPSNLNLVLDYDIIISPSYSGSHRWKLEYKTSNNRFDLFRENSMVVSDIQVGVGITIPFQMGMTINQLPPGIQDGDSWAFITYAYGRDIILTDLSIPIIHSGSFEIEVKENYG